MKDFLKKYKKVYMALIIIVVAFPAVILLKSPIGIIPRNIGVEIINYGGNIIGGFIGLVGIYITLEYENNKTRYENKQKVIPLLEIKPIKIYEYIYKYIQFDFMFTKESWKRERKNIEDTATVSIAIKNVGYRELYDLYLGDFTSDFF